MKRQGDGSFVLSFDSFNNGFADRGQSCKLANGDSRFQGVPNRRVTLFPDPASHFLNRVTAADLPEPGNGLPVGKSPGALVVQMLSAAGLAHEAEQVFARKIGQRTKGVKERGVFRDPAAAQPWIVERGLAKARLDRVLTDIPQHIEKVCVVFDCLAPKAILKQVSMQLILPVVYDKVRFRPSFVQSSALGVPSVLSFD